jgi:hypothetical protein
VPPIKHEFDPETRHSLVEQQAALNLAQLASQTGTENAQLLIDALIVSSLILSPDSYSHFPSPYFQFPSFHISEFGVKSVGINDVSTNLPALP